MVKHSRKKNDNMDQQTYNRALLNTLNIQAKFVIYTQKGEQ